MPPTKIKKTQKIEQIAELFPGILSWLIILAPIWLTFISPLASIALITFVFAYIAAISILFLIGLFIGYFQLQKEVSIDWLEQIKALDFRQLPEPRTLPKTKNNLPFFAIIIPSLKDPYTIIQDNLKAILKSNYPKENILAVFTLEGKNAKWARQTKRKLEKQFQDKVNLIVTIHKQEPQFPPGGAANRRWGSLESEKWLKKHRIPLDSVILYTHDSDAMITPQFLAAIAYRYLIVEKRKQKFYTTAAHFFDNNVWKSHFFARIQGASLSVSLLSHWVFNSYMMESFSAFGVNFDCMKKIDYWDATLAIDDTPTSLRLFFHFNGDFHGEAVYLPIHSDCVEDPNFIENHISLYKQQLRWGWGTVVEARVLIRGIIQKWGKIPIHKLLFKIFTHFVRVNIVVTSLFILSFGISTVRMLNTEIGATALLANISNIMTITLGVIGLSAIPITLLRFQLFKKIIKNSNFSRKVLFILETPLFVASTFIFNVIPYLESQTFPLVNKRLGFVSVQKQERSE